MNQTKFEMSFVILVICLIYPHILFGQTFKIKNEIELESALAKDRSFEFFRSADTVLMTEKLNDNTVEVYLSDLMTDTKKVIDRINTDTRVYAELSSDGRFAVYAYRDLQKKKVISKVYDTQTGEITTLEHSMGDLFNASVSPRDGTILYEVRERGEVPEIYLSRGDGSAARLVAHGIGPTWSPDGKWFIFKPMTEENVHPIERYRKGKITKEELTEVKREKLRKARSGEPLGLPLYIFDSKANKQIELKEFGDIAGEFKWSPNATKLAFRARDRSLSSKGLYIIELRIAEDQIANYQSIFISYTGYYPDWSPDGKYLAYTEIEETEDHHNIANKDVYVIRADGSNPQNLTNTSHTFEEKPHWTRGGNLIISREGKVILLELEIQ